MDGWTNGRKKKERRRIFLGKEAVLFFSIFSLLFKCLSKGIGFEKFKNIAFSLTGQLLDISTPWMCGEHLSCVATGKEDHT